MKRSSSWLGAAAISLGLLGGCSPSSEEKAPDEEAASSEETPKEVVPADPESFPEVVAKVNGTEIHKGQLIDRVAAIASQSQGALETSSVDFYRRVLDDLVQAELLYQSSKAQGRAVSSSEVDAQMASIRSRLPDPAAFEQALAAEGFTEESLRKQMERDMSIQKLIETDIAPRVSVTDDEKRRFYDDNGDQMKMPDRLRLSHILKRLEPNASPEARAAARKAIEDVLALAQSGSDFAALARQHSEDPGSAQNGGEMVITRGQTVPPFEEAAFALEPGGLSPVVETQFGFHIIKLSEKMVGERMPYEQVEPRIEQYLKQQGVSGEVEREVKSLRESGSVEVFI